MSDSSGSYPDTPLGRMNKLADYIEARRPGAKNAAHTVEVLREAAREIVHLKRDREDLVDALTSIGFDQVNWFSEPVEGWDAALMPETCECDDAGCICCDAINITERVGHLVDAELGRPRHNADPRPPVLEGAQP